MGKRLIADVAIAIILVASFVIFKEFPKRFWPLAARWPRMEYPELYVLPQRKVISVKEGAPKIRQRFFAHGLSFGVPWNEPAEMTTAAGGGAVKFEFDGKSVTLTSSGDINLLEVFLGRDFGDAITVKNVFGEKVVSSNYAFHKAILQSSPDQANMFSPETEIRARSILLGLKLSVILGPAKNGIYFFEIGDIGFLQFGDQRKNRAIYFFVFLPGGKKQTLVVSGANEEETGVIVASVAGER